MTSLRAAKGTPSHPASDPTSTPGSEPTLVRQAGVVVATQAADLRDHLADWEELARTASEPNPFYEAWHFLPALEAFSTQQHRRFLFLYGQPERLAGGVLAPAPLIGFVPMTCRRFMPGTPLCVSDMWTHPYCFLATPLLRSGREDEALDLLFGWFRHDRLGTSLWRLEQVSGDGPFARALMDLGFRHRRPRFLVGGHARALIEPLASSGEAYLSNAMHNRRVKEIRRKQRQLREKGTVEQRALQAGEAVDPWIDQFLTLEAAGWKGKGGTAFASDPAHAQFFRQMCHGAHNVGKLEMLGLWLNGQPIAMKCNLGDARGLFAFKIAFDESYAPQSPGVLLEAFNIDRLHQLRHTRWMDSCAVPGHFMISRMWTERRLIQNLWMSTGRGIGDTLVSLMPLAQWCKRKLSTLLRRRPPVAPVPIEE
jgi:hypothetical protein